VLSVFLSVLLSCDPGPRDGIVTTVTPTAPVISQPVPREFVRGADVLLPAELGTIKEHFDGSPGKPPVLVIGESHVDLKVQQTVAGILQYLRGVYDVKVVCVEGRNGSLQIPPLGDSLSARRAAAKAELLGRNLDAVGYFALAYPDVQVLGVEDMAAYKEQGKVLNAEPPELGVWSQELMGFLNRQYMDLSADHAMRLDHALSRLNEEDGKFEDFIEDLYRIVGRESEAGLDLATLLERRKSIEEKHERQVRDVLRTDHPMMQRRDQGIVDGTLSASGDSTPVAVVVGSFHLSGIAQRLKAAGRSYVTILAAGVPEDPFSQIASLDDAKVYHNWQAQRPTKFEEWQARRKTGSALDRQTFQNKVSTFGVLWQADVMLRRGMSEETVKKSVAQANLPGNLKIVGCHAVPGLPDGFIIDFQLNGKSGYILFSSQDSPLLNGEQPGKIEHGTTGDRYFALFDGGSGKKPPNKPVFPTSPSEPPGSGGFSKRLWLVVEELKKDKERKEVTLAFFLQDGVLFRAVDDKRRPLDVPLHRIAGLARAYDASRLGPERLFLSQQLASLLLIDIDLDLPAGAIVLKQISERDVLGEISLPHLAALAKEPGTSRLASFEETYVVPWEEAQSDLSTLSRQPAVVSAAGTVVWISEGLAASSEYAATLEALRSAGIRVNESPQPGSTLLLLGSGEAGWRVRLQDGRTVTSSSAALGTALRTAGQVASFGVALPKSVSSKAAQISAHDIAKDRVLSTGRELVEEIRKSDGRETLDRILRRKARIELEKTREKLARKQELERLPSTVLTQLQIDSKATVLRSAA